MHSLRLRERLKGRLAGWRQSTREPGGPGIPGRSEEHERPTARGTPVEAQSAVTQAQRDLERRMHQPPPKS